MTASDIHTTPVFSSTPCRLHTPSLPPSPSPLSYIPFFLTYSVTLHFPVSYSLMFLFIFTLCFIIYCLDYYIFINFCSSFFQSFLYFTSFFLFPPVLSLSSFPSPPFPLPFLSLSSSLLIPTSPCRALRMRSRRVMYLFIIFFKKCNCEYWSYLYFT